MLAAGCSCVPDSGAPWLVFAVLLLGSVAVLVAGHRRRRAEPDRGSVGVRRRGTVAAVLLAALAVSVVIVAPGTSGSLLVLGAGVVLASAGVAPSSWRRRDTRVG
jgi:uncharacterized membrane protein